MSGRAAADREMSGRAAADREMSGRAAADREMRIALIRHPRPLVAAGTCYGRLDVPLHPEAAIVAPPALAGIGRVWSSPARRCRTLADVIAAAVALPLIVDARLLELDFGQWEGRSWDDVPRADLDRWASSPLTFAPPRGESGSALIARVGDFHATLHADGQDCAVVSHGGPLKILSALLDGRPVDLLADAQPIGSLRDYVVRARLSEVASTSNVNRPLKQKLGP
jgi:alpha-ribazole phosphatase